MGFETRLVMFCGGNERQIIEVVRTLCVILKELAQKKTVGVERHEDLIVYVQDRLCY